jgi:preprotein translocase subunit YajC
MILLEGQTGGDFSGMLIMMGGMFVIMYFFMIRPQMKKAKEAKKFQESIAVGDKVMTLGGIHGKVLEVDETTVVIGLDQGRMRVEKAGLAADKRVAVDAEQK